MSIVPENPTRPIRSVAILAGAILLAIGVGSFWTKTYWIPDRFESLMLDAPESEISERMSHAFAHSQAPFQDLAKWMASDRAVIAIEASHLAESKIELWKTQPASQIAPQVMTFLDALQHHIDQYPQATRHRIHQMTQEIAGWNLGNATAERGQILLALEDLIRRTKSSVPINATAANDAMLSEHLAATDQNIISSHDLTAQVTAEFNSHHKIELNNGLPWTTTGLPSLTPSQNNKPIESNTIVHNDSEVLPANRRVSIGQPLKLPTLIDNPKQLNSEIRPPHKTIDFSRLTTLEVMWKLHAQTTQISDLARQTLIERRFNEDDLALAAQLTNPDVAIRLQLVQRLPSLPRADRKDWLYYMTKDPDADVRYGAAAALLTSTDPRLLRRLRADMATDPSPRVQALITR